MNKQFNEPAVLKATERVDKFLSFVLSNSEDGEEWKEIEWADSTYFISSIGRTISISNKVPRVLKAFMCNGYLCVSICGHDRRLNRLVAQAFIPNPDNKPIVHHKNHNKQDNRVSNLMWATHSENTLAYYNNKKIEQIESVEHTGE